MIRLIAIVFALALTASAQAMPVAPLHQPDNMAMQVRHACGAGMHMVNGVCRTTVCAARPADAWCGCRARLPQMGLSKYKLVWSAPKEELELRSN